MSITGKAYYKCGVNTTAGFGGSIVESASLFDNAPAGGSVGVVYQNGGNYAIVVCADRAGEGDPVIADYHPRVQGEFLASTFESLKTWVSNNIDPSVVAKLSDQPVGGYPLG